MNLLLKRLMQFVAGWQINDGGQTLNRYYQDMQIIGGICMRKRITRKRLPENELRYKAYIYRSWTPTADIKLSKLSLNNYYALLLRKEYYKIDVCDKCKQKILDVTIPVGIIKEIKRQERIARKRASNRAYYHNKGYVTDALYDRERVYHDNQYRKDYGGSQVE